MSRKYARIRKVVIPFISLVILMSQVIGSAAISGNEIQAEREQLTYLSAGQSTAQTYTATPSSDKTTLNGSPVTMQAYKINGNNYIKLRDFAQMVNNTPLNFEIEWDWSLNAINMYTGKPYTVVGGEGVPIGPETKQATDTTSTIYVNGAVVQMGGYFIAGNNYFKLRDLGKALGIGIDWDTETKTVVVDSTGTGGNGEVGGTGNSEVQKPTIIDGNYVLTPEQEEYLQTTLKSIGDPIMVKRIEAGWRTTLLPTDASHPGWNKDGSFSCATLKPGEYPPEGVPLGMGGCIIHGDAVTESWRGIVMTGG